MPSAQHRETSASNQALPAAAVEGLAGSAGAQEDAQEGANKSAAVPAGVPQAKLDNPPAAVGEIVSKPAPEPVQPEAAASAASQSDSASPSASVSDLPSASGSVPESVTALSTSDNQMPAQPAQIKDSVPAPASANQGGDFWSLVIERMALDGLQATLARNAVLKSRAEGEWHLALDPGHQAMATESRIKELGQRLSDYLAKPVKLIVSFEGVDGSPAQREERERQRKLAYAKEQLKQDPIIVELQQTFAAQLDEDSIIAE